MKILNIFWAIAISLCFIFGTTAVSSAKKWTFLIVTPSPVKSVSISIRTGSKKTLKKKKARRGKKTGNAVGWIATFSDKNVKKAKVFCGTLNEKKLWLSKRKKSKTKCFKIKRNKSHNVAGFILNVHKQK